MFNVSQLPASQGRRPRVWLAGLLLPDFPQISVVQVCTQGERPSVERRTALPREEERKQVPGRQRGDPGSVSMITARVFAWTRSGSARGLCRVRAACPPAAPVPGVGRVVQGRQAEEQPEPAFGVFHVAPCCQCHCRWVPGMSAAMCHPPREREGPGRPGWGAACGS